MKFKKPKKSNSPDPKVVVGAAKKSLGWKKFIPRKMVMIILISIFLLLIGVVSYKFFASYKADKITDKLSSANKSVMDNDIDQALVHAKEALENDPENVDALLAVANLTAKDDPEEAKIYFERAFELYKQENNVDQDGKSAISYWAAAGLAKDAGHLDQAKLYYQKVIDHASDTDEYQKYLAKQSKAEIERLE